MKRKREITEEVDNGQEGGNKKTGFFPGEKCVIGYWLKCTCFCVSFRAVMDCMAHGCDEMNETVHP